MNEQISLSFTKLADGTQTACFSVMPSENGELVPEQSVSAIIGSHNISGANESKLIAAVASAIAEFRAAKGI